MNTYARMPQITIFADDEDRPITTAEARTLVFMSIASWSVVGAIVYALATFVVRTALHWVW